MALGSARNTRIASCLAMAACLAASLSADAPVPDIAAVMRRLTRQVDAYYRRAQRVVGVERSTVQPIQWNWTIDGLARTVESEVRLEPPPDGGVAEPMLLRNVRRINGREPRERDLTDRSGCTDPEASSPDPLSFLLPSHRDEYQFTSVADGKEHDRAALIVEFRSAVRKTRAELIEDPRGHADCFDWKGPVAIKGRLWIDAETYDVLRLERHNQGPVDVRVPWELQRQYQLPAFVVVDRDDVTIHFKPVTFSDPDETVVLPESLVALTIIRSGLQSVRRSVSFSSYRRFLTTGRMIKEE